MKQLTIQILVESAWVDVATLRLLQPELGVDSPSRLGYNLDYAIDWMDRNDNHACSLTLPIHLMIEHQSPHWFRFLDDIVPSGAARRYWINQLGLQGTSRGIQDTELLSRGTIAPVGNLRIKESLPSRVEGSTLESRRFAIKDVIDRDTDFLEYAQQMGAISGGATGAGGEAPKLLLRCSSGGDVWIDTYQNSFQVADKHYLVKFPRNQRGDDDCDILRAEFHFYKELTAMGVATIDVTDMKLHEGAQSPSLWLPRFDVHWQDNSWQKYGMESVYSALNKPAGSYLNHFDVLTELCALLTGSDPEFDTESFVCEWLKRDLLNIAFGNSDNHGRNTSFLKKNSGISLSPIYDFAPMKADPEGVVRTTIWGAPYEEGGELRWIQIAEKLENLCPIEKSMDALQSTAKKLVGLQERLAERGVPNRILNFPTIGFEYLEKKLTRWEML
ncbi:MAG: type II toxin-antitoxin system HipA family toxin [Granulosicoccus sp.]